MEDSKNIRDVIKRNHSRKLVEKGIRAQLRFIHPARKGRVNRVTHCYSCGHGLSSFEDFPVYLQLVTVRMWSMRLWL